MHHDLGGLKLKIIRIEIFFNTVLGIYMLYIIMDNDCVAILNKCEKKH